MIDLCRALGWLLDEIYVDSPTASEDALKRFHDVSYIKALQRAETMRKVSVEDRRRYQIGANGNPIFGQVFSRPATACGATLAAVELLRDGGVVHNPAGGTHHGRRDRASGFCYFNDPVLGILAMLDSGLQRVAYVDIDAHHCDGVEDAMESEERVLTISIHERERWPFTGSATRRYGAGGAMNLPVDPGFHDDELRYLVKRVVLPALAEFDPQAIILQCGADGLSEDPLSRLELSNAGIWETVREIRPLAPRLLVLGGGGYNPWSVGRCWTGIWAVLNDFEIPNRLAPEADAILRELTWSRRAGRNPPEHWITTLADDRRGGPVRESIVNLADQHTP